MSERSESPSADRPSSRSTPATLQEHGYGSDTEQGAVLITGGAGFIGTNLADHLLRAGRPVVLFDNLSRPGVAENAAWLCARYGDRVCLVTEDVRDACAVRRAIHAMGRELAGVVHLAAQVAVTSSLDDPAHDFAVNAGGTLNLLEALRALPAPPPLLFTSTNKVYGSLEDVALHRQADRYVPTDAALAAHGIDERRPLDFRSPYGCSKGAADQYVLDYARGFGLPAVVFRMSCIYGPHQHGTEDQGWVAHFLRTALAELPLTIYGDGCQVRDCLYVEDLARAMAAALAGLRRAPHGPNWAAPRLAGQAFNIGGGPARTLSLLELIDLIGDLHGEGPLVRWDEWRPCDQRYYASNCGAFTAATGWTPRVGVREGVTRLYAWLARREAAREPGGDPWCDRPGGGGVRDARVGGASGPVSAPEAAVLVPAAAREGARA